MLLMLATGLTTGLAEGALWLFFPVRYHEWLVWIPDGRIRARAEPGQVIENKDGAIVRINKLGFRGPEYAWEPAPGTLRLVVFGGSSTFCFENSSEAATWPARLEKMLSESLGMPVEVINLGLPGFDSTQSKTNYLFLGRALHPHVVLQYDGWNDMKYYRLLDKGPVPFTFWVPNKPWWQKFARATQIGRRARNAFWEVTQRKMQIRIDQAEKSAGRENTPADPRCWEWQREQFEDMANFVATDGRLFVLISQAILMKPEVRGNKAAEPAFAEALDMVQMTFPVYWDAFQKMVAITEEVARKHGAIFVAAHALVPSDLDHFFDSVHLTDEGCDTLARLICKSLLVHPQFQRITEQVRAAASQPAR